MTKFTHTISRRPLNKLGAYLGVRLRQIESVRQSNDEGTVKAMLSTNETQKPDPLLAVQQTRRDADASDRRWVMGLTLLVGIVVLGVTWAATSHPTVEANAPVAEPAELGEPVVDISLMTRRPAQTLANLVKVMPASGQSYRVTVQVRPIDTADPASQSASP